MGLTVKDYKTILANSNGRDAAYNTKPIGKAIYKGKPYNLLYKGKTKYGERAHLQFLNGTKDFWVDANRLDSFDMDGNNRGRGKASPKQVNYALNLLSRINSHDWHDTDYGQSGAPKPTRRELEKMTSQEISHLIDDIRY